MSAARALLALTLTTALVLAGSTSARASLDLSITNSTTLAGGTGSFDVILSDNGGTFAVSGFSFELRVATGSGVRFASVSTSTAAMQPYIFGTLQSSPFSFTTFPTNDFIASDSDMTAPGTVTLTTGSLFGLGHITYTVAPGTPVGPVAVTFQGTTGTNRTTEVDDINGTPFAITTTPGTILVTTTAAVPEPSSALLITLGLLGVGLVTRRSPRR